MNLTSLTFDECLDRFDEAWGGDVPPRLDDFLFPIGHADHSRLLRELIKIDLEYHWRRVPPTIENRTRTLDPDELLSEAPPLRVFLEDYVPRFESILTHGLMPIDLIAEEYRIRRRWGDNPSPSSYEERFPNQSSAVSDTLKAVDQELSTRQSFVGRDARLFVKAGHLDQELSSVPANRHTLVVGQQIDDFRLLNELGQGAFARVFLAQQVSMQRLVALKVSDHRTLESPILSQLEHPNIVRVFDERQVGSMYLMYMQFVPGGSLRDVIDRLPHIAVPNRSGQHLLKTVADKIQSKGEASIRGESENPLAQLDWGATVAWLGARAADALAHAHRLGVRHRDIKPENILLNADGHPMLVDFNLSFGATVQGASVEEAFGGSLAYMSPEHIKVLLGDCSADSVNEASDVYSLGAVLYEMLTGRRPFEQGNDISEPNWTLTDHLQARQHAPRANYQASGSDRGLHSFLLQCLAYRVDARPASASQVARRLLLCSIQRINLLLSPMADTWAMRWSKQPITWYLALGMLPNALLSPLNIWANHRIAIENFDHAFFHRIEEPVVNLVAFPSGLLLAWWLAVPISKAMSKLRANSELDEPTRSQTARRCLSLPILTAMLVLFLWSASGLVFPWWNQWASGSLVAAIDFLGFFLSQVLHGLIAACLSFVLVSLVTLRSCYPRLLPIDANVEEYRRLGQLDRQLGWANACLEMTPLFAILAIALSDQFDKLVFVALALVGFIGHTVATMLIPKLRTTIGWLQLALGPTDELLLYHEPPSRIRS